jgi:hypothetical protein
LGDTEASLEEPLRDSLEDTAVPLEASSVDIGDIGVPLVERSEFDKVEVGRAWEYVEVRHKVEEFHILYHMSRYGIS